MFRRISLLLFLCSFAFCVGCGDSHEKAVSDAIGTMDELASTLESLETVDDAKAAQGELDRIVGEMQAIQKRIEAMEMPDETKQAALKEQFKTEGAEVLKKFVSARFSLATKPKVSQEVNKTLSKMSRTPLRYMR